MKQYNSVDEYLRANDFDDIADAVKHQQVVTDAARYRWLIRRLRLVNVGFPRAGGMAFRLEGPTLILDDNTGIAPPLELAIDDAMEREGSR